MDLDYDFGQKFAIEKSNLFFKNNDNNSFFTIFSQFNEIEYFHLFHIDPDRPDDLVLCMK